VERFHGGVFPLEYGSERGKPHAALNVPPLRLHLLSSLEDVGPSYELA
jgi:hypothetical protein